MRAADMSAGPAPKAATGYRKLVSVTWPLMLIMSVMLLLCAASIATLSAVRAYVNGEGLWSKAERQAVAELRNYADSGRDQDYRRFEAELAVPLGDHRARVTLQSAAPDLEAAAAGFAAGRNDPADIPGMIHLFRLFHSSALMAPAVEIWTEGDGLITQLARVGAQLHGAWDGGSPGRERTTALLQSAQRIHDRLAPLEDGFSASLGVASRRLATLLLAFLTACGAVLVAAGAAISRANLRRSERMASALRASEERVYLEQERAQVTLGSISDAVISVGRDRRITYMNGAAGRLIGWSPEAARERLLEEVLCVEAEPGTPSVTASLDSVITGGAIAGSATGVILKRRDGTGVAVHERAAPLWDRNGETIGIVLVLRDVTQERAFATRLRHQATHDALTGLANRAEFETQLQSAIESYRDAGTHYAVLYMDLDQFKVINDTSGHAAGDELIRRVAWAVGRQLRGGDLLARLGGDEFGALIRPCTVAEALSLAERIRHQVSELRFNWQDKLFVVTTSIGVLPASETHASVSDALSAADQACYLAKEGGRNRVQVYRPDDRQVQMRLGEMCWVERINAALERNSFALLAQEIRPIGSGGGPGRARQPRCELLLRMVGPEGAWIEPMAFIPAAERFGLMPRIDRWVIGRACQELAALRDAGKPLPSCMINLSGSSVSDVGLADYISDCLRDHALTGGYINFELTETAAIGNITSAAELMTRLTALGCSIALDDFGSGMSSFSYLKALPVSFLKIDGTFVRDMMSDPVDFAVVEAIQRIGRVMGIHTVAECVESAAALEALARIGVDYAQGFHLHRPVPLAQIGSLVKPAERGRASLVPA
jgi:diguanylate cyclase (GGDEF)-like protein/PAS domain S-box-containing protein